MKDATAGDFFSYDYLSKQIGGEDPRKVWQSVKVILRRDHNRVFDCVRAQGWKCLSAGEIIDKGAGVRRKIRRIATNRLKEIKVVDPVTLPVEERTKYNAEVAITGLIKATVSDEIRRQALQGKTLALNNGPSTESLKATFSTSRVPG